MKRKKAKLDINDDFKLKKPFGLHGLYKKISASRVNLLLQL